MKRKIVNFIKSFTPFQIIYLSSVLLITVAFIIFMPENMLDLSEELDSNVTIKTVVTVAAIISVLANPVCEIFISKQSYFNFIVDIFLIEIPELILCVANGWYSIAISTVAFWIPIDIISILRWNKHADEEHDEMTAVKRMPPAVEVVAIIGVILFGLAVGSLIKMIPGAADSYIDALATAFGMSNGILLMLRYSEHWFAWYITLALYTYIYISGGAYIMLVTVAAMLVNTTYGLVKWFIYSKKHPEIK